VPAKSKHMEQRKQRIANAKKNARLAEKLRRRRQLQALGGLLAIAAVLTLAYLWQSGSWFFGDDEPAAEETPTGEVTATVPVDPGATVDPSADPSATPSETTSETTE
jgi:ferric-dicitrate binding protein FerR (iron transport regulator)